VPRVRGNHARLGQVFVNLLVNAIQSIPEGDPDHHEVRVSTSTDADGRAVVEVSDTGRGIPEPMRERVFDPFYTGRDNGGSGGGTGTGLGLSVCHAIVHQLGGEISFESETGRGTTFRVVLPSDPKAPPASAGVAAAPRRRRVLIVDDETGVGRALQRVLRHYDGVLAATGEEALEQLHAGEFDVVFCDVNLPDMDGLTVFERACDLHPPLASRFVFITGGVLDGDLAAALEDTGAPIVEKPFDLRRVRDLVEQLAGPG
jgi:CheY-like chemotaxis protein